MPGENLLRISQPGNLLSLEIPANAGTSGNISVATLPKLLTGSGLDNTSGLTVNSNGQVEITASGIPVNPGDVVAKSVTSGTATLSAAQNLTLTESQLQTTRDLNIIEGKVKIDSEGKNLIIGNNGLIIPLASISVSPAEAKQLVMKHPFFWAPFTRIGSPW